MPMKKAHLKPIPSPVVLNALLSDANAGKLQPTGRQSLLDVLESGASDRTKREVREAFYKSGDIVIVVEALIGWLGHKDKSVRRGVAAALRTMDDPTVEAALEKAVQSGPSKRIRDGAKKILHEIKK
jgi:HEAT repeat protein